MKLIKVIYQYLVISRSGLFDKNFYLKSYQDVNHSHIDPLFHYLTIGWLQGRDPSKEFNTNFYLSEYKDVRESSINPLLHYIKFGSKEGRVTSPIRKETIDKSKNGTRSGSYKEEEFVKKDRAMKFTRRRKPNQSEELFIHIGQYKTGTSIIQNFLDVNRSNLFSNHKLLYPNFDENNLVDGRCQKHYDWYQSVRTNDKKFIRDLMRVKKFGRANNINKIVLSSEDWFTQLEIIDQINSLKKYWNDLQIKVIFYLRRIDSYIESAWKQYGLKVYDDIDEFYHQPFYLNLYKYSFELLGKWERVIGNENILFRPYEKTQLPNGLISDFLMNIGIEYESSEWIEPENSNQARNYGFNRDVLEILHLSREILPGVNSTHMFDLFSDLLGEKFQKAPFEPYLLLSPNQRSEILAKNNEYEGELAKKYLKREDKKVFYESYLQENEDWQPYDGLTIEKIIPIFVKMIDESYKRIRKLEYFKNASQIPDNRDK